MSKRKKKTISSIEKFIEKTSFKKVGVVDIEEILAQAVSLGKQRGESGLTEGEKFSLVKKALLALWINKTSDAEKSMNEFVGKDKTVDKLIKFAVPNIGHNVAIIILEAFGTENPDIIDNLVFHAKNTGRGSVAMSVRALKSCRICSSEIIDFVVEWAIEKDDSHSAIEAASLRKEKGLTQIEIEKLLASSVEKGYHARSKKIANMRTVPGLTGEEIKSLTACVET